MALGQASSACSQSVSWAGSVPVSPCRNPLSGGYWGGPFHNKRYDCKGLVLLLLPGSCREVTPADIYFAFINLFNAILHPPSWFTPILWFWGQAEGNLSGPNLLSIELHNFLKLRNYFSNVKTLFSRKKFEEQYIVFSYWTSILWRSIHTYNSPLLGHWFRVSGKAGMLSHFITFVSYFLLNWLHERKNSCWNSEPSLCKLVHFQCYIWSNIEHQSKYAALADFQIIRYMYLPQIRVGVDPAVKLDNRKPQSLPEEGNYCNIPSTK